ncbi:MAG: KUP/HAK/KT family potassium transporter [Candidatus Eremiobacteraeota bacterium]|nr:KUP/HAK/KT family potassium transporter [Candidatus Eremiobacteraeota bacterium]MBV9699850.1 KUP/HAK/KT family potassium transporter [Candidatus Eremiobacteraeota bacterium]
MRKPLPAGLALAALGVVFGDIGTSPLYTLKTCFTTAHVAPTAQNAVGIVSLLIWTLFFVVCIKYVTVLMRIDHDGEGGILALLARAEPPRIIGVPIRPNWLVWIAVIGGAMILGDGMITPAISVISAIEGLNVATPAAQPLIVPISAGILLGLFAIQWRGTQGIGGVFGPIMALWFAAIALTGVVAILAHPAILAALNPLRAAWFVTHHGVFGFLIFGAIVLGMTGAEALYADMSHFGRIPITLAWYVFVLPALVLNYVGQGAIVASSPKALDSPFYALTQGWELMPMVALATAATIIASQSLISGAFTLTEQAIALNLSPRMAVLHTSKDERGQVYVPLINAILATVCVLLVITFRSSDRLAAMYGLAVAATMLSTDVVFYVVATRVLHWNRVLVTALALAFALVDATFVAAGLPKFIDGAWVPLLVAAAISLIAVTWLTGRRAVAREMRAQIEPLEQFEAERGKVNRELRGAVVLLSGDPTGVPFLNSHRWLLSLVEEKLVVLLTITFLPRPYVREEQRVAVDRTPHGVVRVRAAFGYMESPRIGSILRACETANLSIDDDTTAFVYANPVIVRKPRGGMLSGQRRLFEIMQRLSRSLATDLQIKANRRIALGVEVAV